MSIKLFCFDNIKLENIVQKIIFMKPLKNIFTPPLPSKSQKSNKKIFGDGNYYIIIFRNVLVSAPR